MPSSTTASPRPLAAETANNVRRHALKLLKTRKFSAAEVAEICGVHFTTVHRWIREHDETGHDSLKPKAAPKQPTGDKRRGRPCSLTAAQLEQFRAVIRKLPTEQGYPTRRWTIALMTKYIQQTFDVTYKTHSVYALIRREFEADFGHTDIASSAKRPTYIKHIKGWNVPK